MDITVKIEGLDQLTEAIALVGSALANTKGMIKTQEALEDIGKKQDKPQDKVDKPVEKVEKPQEPQATVPTGKQAYTFEQIQLACAQVSQDGKREELKSLINNFGLNSLLELEESQYNDFVLKLREIGGTI